MSDTLLNCKKDFPIFNNQNVIYLDTASTSQKPRTVINAMVDFYQEYNANVHRGLYPWAEKATSEYESARNQIADYINATSNELIFTKGTTESINFISSSWGSHNVSKGTTLLLLKWNIIAI